MPVKYKFVDKARPGSKLSDIKAPVTVYAETTDPEIFLEKLKEELHISKADIIRFLYALQKLLIKELTEGNIVQTGVIGSFTPSVKKSKKQAAKGQLEIVINYRPATEMRKELNSARLQKIGKSEEA